ncbi:MAG: hypothetical protein ACLQG5_01655 [Methanobacterium sp.]|jgi:hypothetical protein
MVTIKVVKKDVIRVSVKILVKSLYELKTKNVTRADINILITALTNPCRRI